MNKKTEIKKRARVNNDGSRYFFEHEYGEQICDSYLYDLMNFLFEHRGHWESALERLKKPDRETGLGGNRMYFETEGPIVSIYEYFTIDDMPEDGIKINRADLIKLLEAWQQVDARSDIYEVILQRDKKHISLIVKFDDGTIFERTFNYRWQDEPYSNTGDPYIDTLREFLYEHRYRAGGMVSVLKGEKIVDCGVNKMYMHVEGPIVTIYNYFDETPEKNAIKINKDLLIKLFETLAEDTSLIIENIDLQITEKKLLITVKYEEENFSDLIKVFDL